MIGILPFEGFEKELLTEAPSFLKQVGSLYLYDESAIKDKGINLVWAKNIWLSAEETQFTSITEAANILKSKNFLWSHMPNVNHRRAQLIQEKLPSLKSRTLDYLGKVPPTNLGAWTLTSENSILFSKDTTSPFPDGNVEFHEDKENPPSRAYLKLWELFTVYGCVPKAGEKVIDLGSSPGGWTWVLAELGCEVISVDKAALADNVQRHPGVKKLTQDAFTINPEVIGPVDWIFSDIICYPQRLIEIIESWSSKKLCYQFVVTIKFQGPTDYEILETFKQKMNANVKHLCANKHEATAWIRISSH